MAEKPPTNNDVELKLSGGDGSSLSLHLPEGAVSKWTDYLRDRDQRGRRGQRRPGGSEII